MFSDDQREVRFDLYCKKCKHEDSQEIEDPCDECLEHPFNVHTDRPVKYEEKKK